MGAASSRPATGFFPRMPCAPMPAMLPSFTRACRAACCGCSVMRVATALDLFGGSCLSPICSCCAMAAGLLNGWLRRAPLALRGSSLDAHRRLVIALPASGCCLCPVRTCWTGHSRIPRRRPWPLVAPGSPPAGDARGSTVPSPVHFIGLDGNQLHVRSAFPDWTLHALLLHTRWQMTQGVVRRGAQPPVNPVVSGPNPLAPLA